jgi:GT2 family glycosyltransferase
MLARLPTVVVLVFNSLAGFDACLASLERTLPAGAKVLIADDASSDPQLEPLARGWCDRSKLSARYVRRETTLGLAINCDAAIKDTGEEDVVLLGADAITTPGWLQQLAKCAAGDSRIASIAPWSNDAELCSFPRFVEQNPAPEFPEAIAEAAASVAWSDCPELPAAMGACVFLRRAALRQIGGLDTHSFSGARATDDFCRRAAAMGWKNVLCPSAFVARGDGDEAPGPTGEELSRLVARWPDYQEQVARFILTDPLRPLRERLQARIDELARSGPQRDLFN